MLTLLLHNDELFGLYGSSGNYLQNVDPIGQGQVLEPDLVFSLAYWPFLKRPLSIDHF